ncbi:RHS Repeat protein [compost metagenome]
MVKKDKTTSKDYYYLYNGHGDIVQKVDTSGAVVNSYAYDVCGNITTKRRNTKPIQVHRGSV